MVIFWSLLESRTEFAVFELCLFELAQVHTKHAYLTVPRQTCKLSVYFYDAYGKACERGKGTSNP